jgi:hypothetical protein
LNGLPFLGTNSVLAAALVAIYVLDSMHLLCIGEAIVRIRANKVRGVSFGSSFEWGGRRPYLPNPLTPFRPELRVEWMGVPDISPPEALEQMRRHLRAIHALGGIATICAALIVGVAPVALVLGHDKIFVASAIASFLFAIAGCLLATLRRRELALTPWQLCSLSVVALVCLPCSGNFARALSAQRRWSIQAADLPALGADGPIEARVREKLLPILENARQIVDERSPEHRLLMEQLVRLQENRRERQ